MMSGQAVVQGASGGVQLGQKVGGGEQARAD